MTVVNFNYPKFKYTIASTGQPGVGYKLFTYEEGTSTKKTTWTSLAKTGANTNPIILDANGEADVWIDGNYKFVLAPPADTDPPTSPVWTYDAVRSTDGSSVTAQASFPLNGSFELDVDADGIPDSWTVVTYSGGTAEIDSTSSSYGTNSLKFTSTGSGGGSASTEDYYEVEPSKVVGVNFSIISADVDTLNKVQVYWYNSAKVFLSSSDAYNNGATNPTSWTRQYTRVTAPATARYARIILVGVDPLSVTHSTTQFDNVEFIKEVNSLLVASSISPASDADYTLSAEEYNSNIITWATGSWTQARNAIVPAQYRGWDVINNGSYAVTVKTASGTGITVFPGTSRYVVCDGTNVVDPITHYSHRSIQPVTASVGSNALTVTLNPTVLDFRSSTITSGTVNRREIYSPISVTVSSGSTLGTSDGIQHHLAILAIDNAGTIELAVANMAGGINLDESTLISTTAEGGVGGADTKSIAYSTTARSNVPFRVVGMLVSTQATAGTWASAPTTIQGNGGEAFTSLHSFGYGQTWQDLTGSRVNNTTYTNSTSRPIEVAVVHSLGNNTNDFYIQVDGITVQRFTNVTNTSGRVSASATVPPGSTYLVFCSLTLESWLELR